jgi:hypothetical protein
MAVDLACYAVYLSKQGAKVKTVPASLLDILGKGRVLREINV